MRGRGGSSPPGHLTPRSRAGRVGQTDRARGRQAMSGGRLARILIAAVLAVLVVVPASAGAATGRQWSWRSCNAEAGRASKCAVAQVPLNYPAPNGPAISIALTRLPATDPAHRIGSLFLAPGGPGLSGVDYVLEAGARLFTDEVRARFDLVGFDPRGIARSTPLRCFDSPTQWPPSLPFTFPLTREQAAQWAAKDRALESACRQRGGPILNHMSTANAARDLDVLRELVGDNQLSYDGTSYGTYLGVTYANLFPDRVRALVLDGVDDPIAWSTGRGNQGRRVPFTTRLRIDVGTQQTLSQFFRLCDAGGPRCAFSGHAARRDAALVRRLRQHPPDPRPARPPVRRACPPAAPTSRRPRPRGRIDPDRGLHDPDRHDRLHALRLVELDRPRGPPRAPRGPLGGAPAGDRAPVARDGRSAAAVPGCAGARAASRHRGELPQLARGPAGRRVLGQYEPDRLRGLVGQRHSRRRALRLLRPLLDVAVEPLRRVARRRRGPVHGAVEREDGASCPRDRQPVRSRDALRRRGDRPPPAAALGAAHAQGMGSHVAVLVIVRGHNDRALPPRPPAPAAPDGLPPGRRAVHDGSTLSVKATKVPSSIRDLIQASRDDHEVSGRGQRGAGQPAGSVLGRLGHGQRLPPQPVPHERPHRPLRRLNPRGGRPRPPPEVAPASTRRRRRDRDQAAPRAQPRPRGAVGRRPHRARLDRRAQSLRPA